LIIKKVKLHQLACYFKSESIKFYSAETVLGKTNHEVQINLEYKKLFICFSSIIHRMEIIKT